ncbi:hypothetical protein CMI47_12495 [Candidatus Pacearchaeota archaeon]|nr:hypothetical protein [Candidatus Pacearchaeota archaeon]
MPTPDPLALATSFKIGSQAPNSALQDLLKGGALQRMQNQAQGDIARTNILENRGIADLTHTREKEAKEILAEAKVRASFLDDIRARQAAEEVRTHEMNLERARAADALILGQQGDRAHAARTTAEVAGRAYEADVGAKADVDVARTTALGGVQRQGQMNFSDIFQKLADKDIVIDPVVLRSILGHSTGDMGVPGQFPPNIKRQIEELRKAGLAKTLAGARKDEAAAGGRVPNIGAYDPSKLQPIAPGHPPVVGGNVSVTQTTGSSSQRKRHVPSRPGDMGLVDEVIEKESSDRSVKDKGVTRQLPPATPEVMKRAEAALNEKYFHRSPKGVTVTNIDTNYAPGWALVTFQDNVTTQQYSEQFRINQISPPRK